MVVIHGLVRNILYLLVGVLSKLIFGFLEVITKDESNVHVDRSVLNKSLKAMSNKDRIAMQKSKGMFIPWHND